MRQCVRTVDGIFRPELDVKIRTAWRQKTIVLCAGATRPHDASDAWLADTLARAATDTLARLRFLPYPMPKRQWLA
jgi:hypothetical protein